MIAVMSKGIQTANIDHPDAGHGTTWDQIYRSKEESDHLARAALAALTAAGFVVVPKGAK
jgi:hypothetical protein